ncbi:ABC-F family ATP-binding cassette domain-containing protein [Sphingobacterium sp. SGG-5]|uniref:ribosomal protection-like ABC-F family protein n=1 Tax=Sphingobacterium sp. SGG-5 TaxID=2710881 RepID=UPI0013ECC6E8|nr:ABC-F family ATP-binding cassette domain-containing protein [Sphingobacterium sp. SGG-5]NGM63488.1 ABC-F family ATP-binding cassette domain-containing protein [Sphingobacterium sp. SGG-5]
MIILQKATYIHPNKEVLFQDINLVINPKDKIALIGNNGTGKSTLLKIIAGELGLSAGQLSRDPKPYYIPQLMEQYENATVAQVLHVDRQLKALADIVAGQVSEQNFDILNDDWTIEDRCHQALADWGLHDLSLYHTLGTLSGGQKTKVFLAGISLHEPDILLMDEPSNHLDREGRKLLYDFVENTNKTLLLVSHDRDLLNRMPVVAELRRNGISLYGGNYEFYSAQKDIERRALDSDIKSQQKELQKAKEKEREATERQQRLNARGKKKQEKAGLPKIVMNGLRNKAEGSTSKLKSVHQDKLADIQQGLQNLRSSLPDIDQMRFGFNSSGLHVGKTLVETKNLNIKIKGAPLWSTDLEFRIRHGDRIVLEGSNGSGKTTLIKLILGKLEPDKGEVFRTDFKSIYVDQDYSIMHVDLSVYEMAQSFNNTALQEHEIKIRLSRFLFEKESWGKPCRVLSGGEKMRLLLCCMNISSQAPAMIILDEPTNNIDIQNIAILTSVINAYEGTLVVVSHDRCFLDEINIRDRVLL